MSASPPPSSVGGPAAPDPAAPDPAAPDLATKRRLLARLRRRLAGIESVARGPAGVVLPLGLAGIDQTLPGGGLGRGGLHELLGSTGGPADRMAAAGFAALLLGRFAKEGQVLWIGPEGDLFAPGLVELGLPPERLIVVRVRARDARLWALEEGLRCPGLVAALAEIDRLDLTRSRRLQLAAEAHGVTAFVLRPSSARPTASVALTRWQVTALTSSTVAGVGATRTAAAQVGLGPPRWQLELFRCRGGRTGRWTIEWREEAWHEITDSVPVAAPAADRPAAAERPARRRA